MSQEPEYDDFDSSHEQDAYDHTLDQSGPTEEEQAAEILPFGMSGVTGILNRLNESAESGEWSLNKQKMVAEYILGLAKEYWLSTEEKDFCRGILAH